MRQPRHRKAFTLIEMLVVIAIIAILTGLIAAAIGIARKSANNAKARAEMGQLMAAFEQYAADWGQYPPDNNTDEDWDSAQCLVFYLGAEFVAGEEPHLPWDWSQTAGFIATKSRKPLFQFPASRLKDDGYFEDPWGKGGGRDVWYYQFDNNQADGGIGVCDGITDYGEWEAEDDGSAVPGDSDYNNWNVTNWRRDEIDIWCAGPDGTDMVIDLGAPDAWEIDADSPVHYRVVMDSIKMDSDDILGLGN
jgi:prepilin-type N-terminal cleavage/methylation domain-containing protein